MTLILYSALYGNAEPLNRDVFGGYDRYRRVLFTDQADLGLPGVEVIHDPLDGLDPPRASRRAKLMPHRYFPDAEWSIWLDNKSRLLADPARILAAAQIQNQAQSQAQTAADFFAFPHFRRQCVYQEGQAVWENGLDDYRTVKERMNLYRAEGMPENAGLIEGHFILRRHNAPDISHFGERWFEHVLRYSRRDQISFPYLAWKLGLRYGFLSGLVRGETVQLTVFDRKSRKTDFPRKHAFYQELRRCYHLGRRKLGL